MGRPKPLLPVRETTLAGWILERLAPHFDEVLVAGSDPGAVPVGLRLVRDRPGHRLGPLAGIEAGLAAAANDALVAVACDMPRVDASLAERLLALSAGRDAAVPRVGGRPEPACACYRRSALAVLGRALDEGRLKAGAVLAELDVAWLDDADPRLFWNLNTPEDYQVFLSEL